MSIFAEKRGGVPTGKYVVEVMVDGKTVKRRCDTKKEATTLEAQMRVGLITAGKAPKAYLVKHLLKDTRNLWVGHKDQANSLRKLVRVCALLGHETPVATISVRTVDAFQVASADEV